MARWAQLGLELKPKDDLCSKQLVGQKNTAFYFTEKPESLKF